MASVWSDACDHYHNTSSVLRHSQTTPPPTCSLQSQALCKSYSTSMHTFHSSSSSLSREKNFYQTFRYLASSLINSSSFDAISALNSTLSYTDNSMQKRHFQIERRLLTLKDFLVDDSNSCSSSGFKSFPRKASHCTVRNILDLDSGEGESNSNNKSTFLRSRSTATTAISAFQKASKIVINVVMSPSFLQRSLKRRFWRRNSTKERGMIVTVVKVKDIVRMRSFRDVIEEESPPSDSTDSIATTSSAGSSLCDRDSTTDCVQSWNGTNSIGVGDGYADTTTVTTTNNDVVGSKEELRGDEKEQQLSPVSVLDIPFTENAEQLSFLIREEKQEAEERAMRLLDQVKATGSVKFSETSLNDDLLLEFFKDELIKISRRNQTVDAEIWTIAEAWLNGDFEWGVETEKEACIKDMERGGRWRKFEEEEEEMALQLEVLLFDILVDDLFDDFFM